MSDYRAEYIQRVNTLIAKSGKTPATKEEVVDTYIQMRKGREIGYAKCKEMFDAFNVWTDIDCLNEKGDKLRKSIHKEILI